MTQFAIKLIVIFCHQIYQSGFLFSHTVIYALEYFQLCSTNCSQNAFSGNFVNFLYFKSVLGCVSQSFEKLDQLPMHRQKRQSLFYQVLTLQFFRERSKINLKALSQPNMFWVNNIIINKCKVFFYSKITFTRNFHYIM